MKYFEMFAGVGGFSLGIERAYELHNLRPIQSDDTERAAGNDGSTYELKQRERLAHCVGMSEIDKYASAVLKFNYPKTKNYGNCQEINWSEVPDFDLLVGGSPCQDFSIAGKRAGLSGERSGLFTEYLRCLKEKKPKHFIWENVKGVLSSRSGWDFANIQVALAEAGYSLWWQVLNAKDFGVPQNRERIFVVGTREGSGREVLFEAGDSGRNLKEITKGQSQGNRIYKPEGIATTIASQAGGLGAKTGLYRVDREASKTIRVGGQKSPHESKQNWDSYEINGKIRRLTPTECERLMSWPDGWTDKGIFNGVVVPISDTQRYKMCGNGVVSEVVAEVVKAHQIFK